MPKQSCLFLYFLKVKIYNDLGGSKASVAHCLYSLKLHLPKNYTVGYISALEIIEGNGLEDTRLYILPGGKDLYYMESLQGKGNKRIQDYRFCRVYSKE